MATSTSTGLGSAGAHSSVPDPEPSNSQHLDPSSNGVEMSELESSTKTTADSQAVVTDVSINPAKQHDFTSPAESTDPTTSKSQSTLKMSPAPGDENTRPKIESNTEGPVSPIAGDSLSHPNAASTSDSGPSAPPAVITRLDSVAIGPSTDIPPTPVTSEAGPALVITLLLTSGARHPYKIDEKYLTKRNVNVPGVTEGGRKDPYSISVYTLKELILREWREEWEAQPSSPSSIRLIYFGKLLDDKTPLKDYKFNVESTNVVHMTVRPQDIVDEEDASKSKALSRGREDGESNAGCRCVIL